MKITQLLIAALSFFTFSLSVNAQSNNSEEYKYVVKDSASGKYVSSKVVEVNAKKETIFHTLFMGLQYICAAAMNNRNSESDAKDEIVIQPGGLQL